MKCIQRLTTTGFASLILALMCTVSSCGVTRNIRNWTTEVLKDSAFAGAHTGLCIYDPQKSSYLYQRHAASYFVPASNTKIPTCYAAMKYLGDSLTGLRYRNMPVGGIELLPTGDPTLLHTDFASHPVLNFLYRQPQSFIAQSTTDRVWKEARFGFGWNWDDYAENYMAEKSALPVYGNMLRYERSGGDIFFSPDDVTHLNVTPPVLGKKILTDSFGICNNFSLERQEQSQLVHMKPGGSRFFRQFVPVFNVTDAYVAQVLNQLVAQHAYEAEKAADSATALDEHQKGRDYIPKKITAAEERSIVRFYNERLPDNGRPFSGVIRSQPTDSVLKPMMHRSDNFYAEQLLLMISNERLGYMNDAAIIDTLLNTDFIGIPQRPRWVDGSGLSRYNLFTPQSIVWILNKMKTEFGLDRLKEILPTGGEGTLRNLYLQDSGFVFAKTGTLSNITALSGFLITQKGRLLIFSIMVNGYMNGSGGLRKGIETLLQRMRRQL